MGLVPRNLGKEIRNKFSTFRTEVGVPVCLYLTPNKEDCPNCVSGPEGESLTVYNSSFISPTEIFGITVEPKSFTRGRCPVCYGKGYLEQEVKKSIVAIVKWNPDNDGDLERTSAGVEGSNIVKVRAAKCYYENLRDTVYAVIDGVECKLLFPPTIRKVSSTEISVNAYFTSTEIGHSV